MSSRFDQRVADHSVRETLVNLRTALAELPDDVRAQVNDAHPGTLDRAAVCIDYIEGLLESVDGRLVTQATLDGIHGHVDQAFATIANLAGSPSAHGATFDQAIESALQSAAALAPASAGFSEAAQKIGRRSGGFARKLRRLDGDADAMRAELRDLEAKAGTGLEELTAEQQARREELKAELETLHEAIAAETKRVSTIASGFEDTFTTDQAARKEAFEELVEDLKISSKETAAKLAADAQAAQAKLLERGQASLTEVEEVRDKVTELYSLVTKTATAGAFHDEAKFEREAADHWRRVAIYFGSAAVVIAVAAIAVAAVVEISPALIVAKVTATVACGLIAGYAAQQSHHHRARGDQAKDLELELVTAEGVLYNLAEDEQRELRKSYFDRAFRGRQVAAVEPTGDEAAAFGLTPEILGVLMAVFKAAQTTEKI